MGKEEGSSPDCQSLSTKKWGDRMALVTLIGEKLAKKDGVFIYMRGAAECRDCKLKNVCFNLEEGKRYKITNIREMHHDCRLHEGGVRVVEVEKIPVPVSVNAKNAVEGETITFTGECRNTGCDFYKLCHPAGVKTGTKFRILKVKDNIECPEKKNLKEALLE